MKTNLTIKRHVLILSLALLSASAGVHAVNGGSSGGGTTPADPAMQAANPDMKLVFFHYEEALRINPKHRGAQEYIGEAYLQTGDLAKAKEHLAALDKLCYFGCEEFTELKAAIGKYELTH